MGNNAVHALIKEILFKSQNPIVLAGGGGWNEKGKIYLKKFVERENLPFVALFRYQDIFDNYSHCYIGDAGVGMASYIEDTIKNAGRFIQEGKADAVKIEGGKKREETIQALLEAEIPVMGHLGLTPQSKNLMGGYKVQGKTLDLARQLFEDALLLQELGCFSMVLEGVPTVVAQSISENINIPTIGIGAGNLTDGQVLVLHDLLGMKSKEYIDAKFVKRYDQQYEATLKALKTYKDEIEKRDFPTDDYSYDMGNDINDSLKEWKKEIKKILS